MKIKRGNGRGGGILMLFLIILVFGCITFYTSQTGLIINLLGRQKEMLIKLRQADLPERPPDQISAREPAP